MNGRLFNNLHALKIVYLSNNDCIDKDFNDENKIAKLSRVVDASCSFMEIDADELKTEATVTTERAKLEDKPSNSTRDLDRISELETRMLDMMEEMQRNADENMELKQKIYEMRKKKNEAQ